MFNISLVIVSWIDPLINDSLLKSNFLELLHILLKMATARPTLESFND